MRRVTKCVGAMLCAAALVLAGCDTVKAPFTGQRDQVPGGTYPNVTVAGELSRFIAVGDPVVEESDVLRVTVPVRLLSDPGNETNIQYRFLFLTKAGAPARGGDMNWRFVHLPPRNQVFLAGNSLDSDAADWRCEVRLAR